ncbi:hypoxia up-regulated protein 1-like isoform X3 [Mytilus californianus]|uniref:hypoxia up-regulated protein 1-like isoform X3 n=1 Tax=Mytilus californianus TaxID=6549 RepID=UPI0022451CFE|nr:hypoxia up-regulated protein 1-like isoform X3 [Mytilus californianus]
MALKLLIAVSLLICMASYTVGFNAVMSIDLGSEYMKIAIVKPGVPMEIVLNEESDRKTSTIVALRNGERFYGKEAENTAVKFPRKAFWYLTNIVGRKFDSADVKLYKERFPYYDLVKDEERGTVLFKVDEETFYSPEELLAMLLEKAKEYAETFTDQSIKDCVITVPAYFTQAERKSILSAAELIDLNVLQLLSDNAAVALNYGVFRRKEFNGTVQYYMFYDMGATSTTATIVGYQVTKVKEGTRLESNPQLIIKGVGFDRGLGGTEITLRLRKHLAKVFNEQKKTKTDVFTNERSMGKLFKEAEKLKKVLSANNAHFAQVEGLLEEIDFKTKVTREELEELSKDLFEKVTQPIEEALKVSQITLGEIKDVILMGGGTRIPKVQEILKKYLGRSELGKSINTDEAAAMGAVYQAAYLGKGFKVKTFGVKEASIYPITVEFEKHKLAEDGSDSKRVVKRTLFNRMNPYPQKKVMTFSKHLKDFDFNVSYGDLDFLSDFDKSSFQDPSLAKFKLSGVGDAFTKHKESGDSKGVKAHFRLDESGILHLDQVEVVFEKEEEKEESTWSKLGNTLGGLFGGKKEEGETIEETGEKPVEVPADEEDKSNKKSDKTEEKTDETKKEKTEKGKEEEKSENKTDDATDKLNGTDSQNKTEADLKEKKPNVTVVREKIDTKIESFDIPEVNKDLMKVMRKKLAELTAKDKEKKLLEKSKNDLEAFIFDMNDKLTQEVYEKCSTEAEREKLSKLMSEASDWMYDQEEDAKAEIYQDKLKSLKKEIKELKARVYEFEERPKALKALKDMLNHTKYFLKSVKNFTVVEEDRIFTDVEITTLEKLITDTKKWRDDMVEEQKKTPDSEKPKLLVEDVALKLQALDREVKYLINKAKNFKPKPKPKPKSNTTKTDGNTTKSDTNKTDKAEKDKDTKIEVEEPIDKSTETKDETKTKGEETETKDEKTKTESKEENIEKSEKDKEARFKRKSIILETITGNL